MARISFNGFTNEYATLMTAESIQAGKAVSVDDEGKAINSSDGDYILGFCTNSRDGFITVQFKGYIEIKYSGAAPGYGIVSLVCNDSGGVRASETSENAVPVKVLKVDENNKTVGFIFN